MKVCGRIMKKAANEVRDLCNGQIITAVVIINGRTNKEILKPIEKEKCNFI